MSVPQLMKGNGEAPHEKGKAPKGHLLGTGPKRQATQNEVAGTARKGLGAPLGATNHMHVDWGHPNLRVLGTSEAPLSATLCTQRFCKRDALAQPRRTRDCLL